MKLKLIKLFSILALFLALNVISIQPAQAQCPMCRIAAESNMKHGGGTTGKGLNAGILYMLATPYLVVGLIGFMWWRNRRKEEDDELVEVQE